MKRPNCIVLALSLLLIGSSICVDEEALRDKSFTCNIFKKYLGEKETKFEIDKFKDEGNSFVFSCPETENLRVGHISFGKEGSTKLMVEVRFGPYEAFKDGNADKSVFCFELVSYFSAKNYNYYQCSPAPTASAITNFAQEDSVSHFKDDLKPLQEGDSVEGIKEYVEYFTELETLFEFMTEELNNMVNYIHEKVEPVEGEENVISPEVVMRFLNKLKYTGDNNVTLDEEEANYIRLVPASEKAEEGKVHGTKTMIEGRDGFAFEYSFEKSGGDNVAMTFCRFNGLIYKSSPNYLRLVLTSAVKEYDLYISRYLLTKQGADTKAVDFLLETYGKQINDIITEMLGMGDPNGGETFLGGVFKLNEDKDAMNVGVMSMPLAGVVVNDVILGSSAEGDKVTRLHVPLFNKQYREFLEKVEGLKEKTTVLYDYESTVDGENDNATLETMEITNYFVQEEGKKPSLGAIYKDLDASQFTMVDFNQALDPNNLYNFLAALHNNEQDNFVMLGYALQKTSRKIFVKLTTFRHEFYKSVNLKFITQFFISEFLVPWSGYNDFKQSVEQVYGKVRAHYDQQVANSMKKAKNSLSPFFVYEEVEKLSKTFNVCMLPGSTVKLAEGVNESTLDCEVPDDKACKVFEVYIHKVKREEARSDQDKIPLCEADEGGQVKDKLHYQKIIVLNKKESDGHEMFSLVISEPFKPNPDSVVKDVSSSYDFFKNYPYDNRPAFINYIESSLTGKAAEVQQPPPNLNVSQSENIVQPKKENPEGSGEQPRASDEERKLGSEGVGQVSPIQFSLDNSLLKIKKSRKIVL